MLPIHTILHPTDFSPQSEHAFKLACSLARDHKARLVVLYVAPIPVVAYGEMVTVLAESSERDRGRAALDRVQAPEGVVMETRLEEGEAAGEILRVVKEIAAGLIVMGTHGRTGLGRLLMGSVAEEVLRRAPCPVLTVKAPFPAESEVPFAEEVEEPASV
jgi:nucleotide-binding universal stress UspA family protein